MIDLDLYYPGKVASINDIPNAPDSDSGTHLDGRLEAPSPVCRFLIRPDMSKIKNGQYRGEFVSPVYPGLHPPGLACVYQLMGLPTQRISITIKDLSLPSPFEL